jgi:hypothetical protein
VAQRTAVNAVLTGTFTALNVAGMTSLLSATGVRNDIPDDPLYPYVRIEAPTEERWDTFGRDGKELLVWVHVFSQARGDNESLTIASKAIELLHYVSVSVASHALARYQLDQHFTGAHEVVAGVTTYHRIVQFRVKAQQTA